MKRYIDYYISLVIPKRVSCPKLTLVYIIIYTNYPPMTDIICGFHPCQAQKRWAGQAEVLSGEDGMLQPTAAAVGLSWSSGHPVTVQPTGSRGKKT